MRRYIAAGIFFSLFVGCCVGTAYLLSLPIGWKLVVFGLAVMFFDALSREAYEYFVYASDVVEVEDGTKETAI